MIPSFAGGLHCFCLSVGLLLELLLCFGAGCGGDPDFVRVFGCGSGVGICVIGGGEAISIDFCTSE